MARRFFPYENNNQINEIHSLANQSHHLSSSSSDDVFQSISPEYNKKRKTTSSSHDETNVLDDNTEESTSTIDDMLINQKSILRIVNQMSNYIKKQEYKICRLEDYTQKQNIIIASLEKGQSRT